MAGLTRLAVSTDRSNQMIDITAQVQQVVDRSDVGNGMVVVYVPHTTAGLTINENADPDVVHDMLEQLSVMVEHRQPFYRHAEGNSAAHVKASLVGFSQTLLLEQGRLVLGTWQGIYFCEFDGPRSRQVYVRIVG